MWMTPVLLSKVGPAPKSLQWGHGPGREAQVDVGARRAGPDGKPGVLAQPRQGSACSLPNLQDVSCLLSFLGLFVFF